MVDLSLRSGYSYARRNCSRRRAGRPARLDRLRRIYGDKAAAKVTDPTEIIIESLQRIDGITYDFKRFVDAESDLQLFVDLSASYLYAAPH